MFCKVRAKANFNAELRRYFIGQIYDAKILRNEGAASNQIHLIREGDLITNRSQSATLYILFICLTLICCTAAEDKGSPKYLSPIGLAADTGGKTLYIAEATANSVAVFDTEAGKVNKTFAVPGSPASLALSKDGALLYIADASPQGAVHVMNTGSGKVTQSIPTGHTSVALLLSPDGKTLYVCNQFTNDLSVIDVATNKEVARVPMVREPFAAAITPDGKTLFVANLLPAGAADQPYVAAVVSVVDTASRKVTSSITLPNGSSSLQGICVSPDGKHVYVTQLLSRYQVPTTQLERGWINTNALSVIDASTKKLINTALLDDVDLGAANPWGVACTADGKSICVAHAGTHEVSVIDRAALHRKLDDVAAGKAVSEAARKPEDVPNALSFLVGIRSRLRLAGNGPRGIQIIGSKIYTAEYYSDSIGVIDLASETSHRPKSFALGSEKPLTIVRRGERFFNDAAHCFQKWQSCASCHTSTARVDAFNWDLLNDGMGNPKNTKSLLLSHVTPPAMVTGVRARAEVAVRAGIKYIQFVVRPEEDAVSLDEFLKSLKPVPSPYLVKGKLSKAAERGQQVFKKADCSACHTGPYLTKMKLHDVGTGLGSEVGRKYDTPTLIEIWRSAPYLHDGRAATIKDVLTKHNPDDEHGETSQLTDKEINDLVEYVLSL